MTRALIVAGMVALGVALVVVNLSFQRKIGTEVVAEVVRTRDVVSVVAAAGTLEPQRQVDLSANTMGRVTRLAVVEGQRVQAGDVLLEIDPRSLEGARLGGEARVAVARSALEQAGWQIERERAGLERARQVLIREEALGQDGLTTPEALEQARTDVAVRGADLTTAEQLIETREQEVRQAEAGMTIVHFDLSQVAITAPMEGLVTRRNVEVGENVVVGTMNNTGTVLLTVADMSTIQAEVEIEETVVPSVQLGQIAEVSIDAVPGRRFRGRVTEIGSSASPAETQAEGQPQATMFRVMVTLDDEVPGVRPGFSCVAEITTATRMAVVAVPIQAMTVMDVLRDADGQRVVEERPDGVRTSAAPDAEPRPGFTREETRGVFVIRDGRAEFTPVMVGISGERYFEVRSGLEVGDTVITGPFSTARRLVDGETVLIRDGAQTAP